MLVGIMGDIHGSYYMLNQFKAGELDLLIQVGDFGMIHKVYPYEIPKVPVWFIDGNHDPVVWLRDRSSGFSHKVAINRNITYIPRGWAEQLGDKVFGFLGGADTPSWGKAKFIQSGLYWPEEKITDEDVNRLRVNLKGRRLDVLICHDAPLEVKWAARVGAIEGDSSIRLQEAIKEFKPGKVFCGHMHAPFRYPIGNSTVVRQLDINEVCTLEV